jgi:hypothetical protein
MIEETVVRAELTARPRDATLERLLASENALDLEHASRFALDLGLNRTAAVAAARAAVLAPDNTSIQVLATYTKTLIRPWGRKRAAAQLQSLAERRDVDPLVRTWYWRLGVDKRWDKALEELATSAHDPLVAETMAWAEIWRQSPRAAVERLNQIRATGVPISFSGLTAEILALTRLRESAGVERAYEERCVLERRQPARAVLRLWRSTRLLALAMAVLGVVGVALDSLPLLAACVIAGMTMLYPTWHVRRNVAASSFQAGSILLVAVVVLGGWLFTPH